MKRQPYFPRPNSDRQEWFTHFGTQLPIANVTLLLPAPAVTAIVADANYLAYINGPWITDVRDFGPAATAGIQTAYYGTGGLIVLPGFVAPPLTGGGAPVPVAQGALTRIFNFVQTIKAAPAYTQDIGLQLGIVGGEDTEDHPLPTFRLVVERGGGTCECVRIVFKKYDRDGVVIHGRRGAGAWEMLGIDLESPYLDERPLLVAGTPEVREYRLQYYDDSAPSGPLTDPQSVTIAP